MEIMKLIPTGKDYLWGGTRLRDEYGKKIDLTPLAETWECSVHPDGPSYVANGTYKGKTLAEVLKAHPEYLGTKVEDGELPVLVKFIDAKKDLSVQVHPSDEYAREHEGDNGKTEMWYVIDADEGASLIYGFQHEVTEEILRKAVETGTLDKHLQKVPVHKGDTRTSGAVRYSMGFAHPNRFGAMLFLIVLYLAYVRREKLNLKDIFFQLFIFVVTYKLTDSRSSELGIAIVIIFTVLSLLHKRRKSKNFSKTQRYIIVIVAISMIAAMFYLAANYDSNNSKMSILNMLFNSRLELGGLTLKYYKPSLFGAGIQTYAWEDVLSQGMSHALVGSDILYLYIYLNYGIISLFIYLYVIVVAIIYAAKNDKWGCLSLIIILMVSCMENQYLPVASNVFVLYFGMYLKNPRMKRIQVGANND